MQPINPWIFYLIDILGNLSFMAIIGVILSGLGLLMCSNDLECAFGEDVLLVKKLLKCCIFTFLICVAIIVFVPSQKAMYQMLTASMVTEDNVDKATKVIQDGVDYIFEKMDGEESSQ